MGGPERGVIVIAANLTPRQRQQVEDLRQRRAALDAAVDSAPVLKRRRELDAEIALLLRESYDEWAATLAKEAAGR